MAISNRPDEWPLNQILVKGCDGCIELKAQIERMREALEARRVADEMWADDAPHNLCHSQTNHAKELSRLALKKLEE